MYLAAVLVIASLGIITSKNMRDERLTPVLSAISIGLTSGFMMVSQDFSVWALALSEIIIAPICTYCYGFIREDKPLNERNIGRLALYVTTILFFSGMHIAGMIGISMSMVVFAILLYSYGGNGQNSVLLAV